METLFGIAQPLSLLIAVAIFIATVFLFKLERGWDAIFMMTGAVMGLASQFLQMLPEFFTNAQPMSTAGTLTLTTTGPTLNQWYIITIVALPMLGGILFAVGFVGYVVRKTINKIPPDKRLHDDAQKDARM